MAGMTGTRNLSKTRRYGGRAYHLQRSYRLKSEADKTADRLRDKGLTARIEKIGGDWHVYRGPKDRR